MEIGQRIKEAREARGMPLEELSGYAGVTRQTLSRYETGTIKNIPSDKIELIAGALRTTPGQLMGWDAHTGEKPAAQNDGLSETAKQLYAILQNLDENDLRRVLDFVLGVISK